MTRKNNFLDTLCSYLYEIHICISSIGAAYTEYVLYAQAAFDVVTVEVTLKTTFLDTLCSYLYKISICISSTGAAYSEYVLYAQAVFDVVTMEVTLKNTFFLIKRTKLKKNSLGFEMGHGILATRVA